MADTIAYVVGGSISHAEIREVEPAPPVEPKPEAKHEPHKFMFKTEVLTPTKPEHDFTLITPVDLNKHST